MDDHAGTNQASDDMNAAISMLVIEEADEAMLWGAACAYVALLSTDGTVKNQAHIEHRLRNNAYGRDFIADASQWIRAAVRKCRRQG